MSVCTGSFIINVAWRKAALFNINNYGGLSMLSSTYFYVLVNFFQKYVIITFFRKTRAWWFKSGGPCTSSGSSYQPDESEAEDENPSGEVEPV